MIRIVLFVILCIFIARAFWRVVDNVIEAAGGRPPRERVPGGAGADAQRRVQMARDPVCGTFVVPENAVSIADGRDRIYFCSEACRAKYRARSA